MQKTANAKPTAAPARAPSEFEQSTWGLAWRRLKKNRAALFGFAVVALFFVMGLAAPIISPQDPLKQHGAQSLLPPVWVALSPGGDTPDSKFLFGTDSLGRDVLSRLIWGARTSMLVSLIPVSIILIIGVTVGLVAGYFGGTADNLLMRLTDVFFALPDLLFYIIMMVSLRDTDFGEWLNGLALLFVALAVVSWAGVARLIRGSALSLRETEFVAASRSLGASNRHIMTRHILPNSLANIIVWVAFAIPRMIITEASLGFIGLGLRPATDSNQFFITSWGSMLLEGRTNLTAQPWILLLSALCVGALVMACMFLGDGLRDALDPRMKN